MLEKCHHLAGGVRGGAEALLQAGHEVVVLAMGRAALRLGGETDWLAPSPWLPEWDEPSDALARSDAVSLFVERAGQVRPRFEVAQAAWLGRERLIFVEASG